MTTPKPVLTIKAEGALVEVFLLNPGEQFPLFGGSRHGLTVSKTASLITRSYAGGMQTDTEYDVTDPKVWTWIARMINREIEVTAEGPNKA